MSASPSRPLLFSLILFSLSIVAQPIVPSSETFKYVNDGEFGEYLVEYAASYRVLSPYAFPFQLCFYNTTPGAYTLGLRMGNRHSESTMRWVWDANRGNPVGENATLTFGKDGNLVLADVNGRIAFQTGTSNKGVVGFKLLSTGNIVLHDKKGGFVWQSFDHPGDTLLVGQGLRAGGPDSLISRVSDQDGSQGPYSFVLEKSRIAMYLKSKNSATPLLYYIPLGQEQLSGVVFNTQAVNDGFAYRLQYETHVGNSSGARYFVGRPKYNATLSMLRLGSDGSLKAYTYNDKVDWGAWEVTYSLFDKNDDYGVSECKLPTRCGELGVCEDSQCVACPSPKGLLGWSKDCAPPRLPSCKGGVDFKAIDYYKVVGVEHFTSEYAQGGVRMKLGECRDKCSKDCRCLGFFYMEEFSKCLLTPELGALIKVSNQTHVAYIKTSK